MTKQFLNPPGLANPGGYTNVVSAEGGKLVFVAGQVAFDTSLQIVGRGDLRAQTRKTFENLKIALEAAGARFSDVVKLNVYVVDYKPADRQAIVEIRNLFVARENPPASTLIGVQALAADGLLVEVEAIAVVG
jgi:enamine deaminase RidA (YjgF/YER057c/UK114 family)